MRVAFDTNVLAYAEGVGDEERCRVAIGLIERLPEPAVMLPAHVLGELMLVLTRKAGRTREAARDAVLGWADSFDVSDSTWASFQSAFDLSVWRGVTIVNPFLPDQSPLLAAILSQGD